jgi:hypothetical protein
MDVALDVRPVATLARAATIETTRRAEQGQPVPSRVGLEQARDYLLERLHARSDDFAATEKLQAVRAELARNSNVRHERSGVLRHSGLSFFDRMRAKRRRRNARRGNSG